MNGMGLLKRVIYGLIYWCKELVALSRLENSDERG